MRQSTNGKVYDLAVVGAGAAGLTAASAGLRLSAHVALIESHRTGGECTWTGCVPSKALLAAAKVAHMARTAERYGVSVTDVQVDFEKTMDFVRGTIQQIYEEETPEALRTEGMHVYEAHAHFTDPHTLALDDGHKLHAKYVLLCTGAKPRIPDGFEAVDYLTNETLFELTNLPAHLVIIGGGPMGTEMAQAFRRLGSQVTVISRSSRLLPRDEEEASRFMMDVLEREGVALRCGVSTVGASKVNGKFDIQLDDGSTVQGDAVLVAVGKEPNIHHLGLDAAGVKTKNGQLVLDDRLRTSQPHILAAGDITGGPYFTHYAGWQAFQAVRNILMPLSSKGVRPTVPWTTFTDPEVAHTGLGEMEARKKHGDAVHVTRLPMSRADRAMTEGRSEGFMKLIHRPNGRLLGATIVGLNAGEMINDWVAVLENDGRVWDAASAMRVYPTMGSANVMLATEQVKKQLESGVLGRLLRGVSRLAR